MSSIIRLGALLFGAVYSITAAPVEAEKRSVTVDCLDQLQLFAQYAGASYCLTNYNGSATKITCPSSRGSDCSDVEAADTNLVFKFENSPKTDVTGFIAVDTTNELIVVSWRGSRSLRNWIANIEIPWEPTSLCDNCGSNIGYWDSWLEAKDQVMPALNRTREQYPNYRVISTGHSLGGAIAALAAGVMREEGIPVDLYTYGQPKLGGTEISELLQSGEMGQTYRVTHKYDLIPKITPALLGWRHISPEYYITSNDVVVPGVADINILQGELNLQGNEGDLGLSISSHLFYFVPMAQCDEPAALIWK